MNAIFDIYNDIASLIGSAVIFIACYLTFGSYQVYRDPFFVWRLIAKIIRKGLSE